MGQIDKIKEAYESLTSNPEVPLRADMYDFFSAGYQSAAQPPFGGDLPQVPGWWWNEDVYGAISCFELQSTMGSKMLIAENGRTAQDIGGRWAKAEKPGS